MKYLCMIFFQGDAYERLPEAEQRALIEEHLAYDDVLRRSGQLLAAEALQPAAQATTVCVRGGKLATTDGPFVETKEVFAGFYLVEARDRVEAEALAAKIPSARIGAIEVRPIHELQRPAGDPV